MSSWVDTQRPSAIGWLSIEMMRPSASSDREADRLAFARARRSARRRSSVGSPANSAPGLAQLEQLPTACGRASRPRRSGRTSAVALIAERSRAPRASNMHRPCDMLLSAASSCSFCSWTCSSALRRSVTSSWVVTQPPPGIGWLCARMKRLSRSGASVARLAGREVALEVGVERSGSISSRPTSLRWRSSSISVQPGRTTCGESLYISRKRRLSTTTRSSASNMHRPCVMLLSAASRQTLRSRSFSSMSSSNCRGEAAGAHGGQPDGGQGCHQATHLKGQLAANRAHPSGLQKLEHRTADLTV